MSHEASFLHKDVKYIEKDFQKPAGGRWKTGEEGYADTYWLGACSDLEAVRRRENGSLEDYSSP